MIIATALRNAVRLRTLALICLLLSAGGVFAATPWYVAPGGDDLNPGTEAQPFATIQHAIVAAQAGDEVLIADGTYAGVGNREIDFLGKGITVRSRSGRRDRCVIRAEGHEGVLFHGREANDSLLSGVTIVGATIGISVEKSFPQVSDCVLDSCVTGIDVSYLGGRVAVEGCLIRRGETGILFRDDATGGTVSSTWISENSTDGVRTQGRWTLEAFAALVLKDCHIHGNQGAGVRHLAFFGGMQTIDCDVFDNDDWGLLSAASQDRGLMVRGGAVHGNGAGGIDNSRSAWNGVESCAVYGNGGHGIQAGWGAIQGISDCVIHDNAGHGISFGNGPMSAAKTWQPVTVSGCTIYGNDGCGIDFMASAVYGDNLVTGCVVHGNAGPGIRVTGTPSTNAQVRILVSESTVVGNAHGLWLDSTAPVLVDHALIAFNLGAAAHCPSAPNATLSCSDLYGNPGGDWTGDIAGQAGLDGNLSLDPLLCDLSGGDFRLLDISPCAGGDLAGCGRIGAMDVGCHAAPQLVSLGDVPDDQGGQLRLTWNASCYDRSDAALPITGYGVYRRQDGLSAADSDKRLLGWDFLATVPSRGDPGYQFVAPTLCNLPASGSDSTGHRSIFMVSAMTADPFTYYDSMPGSGCSIDNLAPAAPLGLYLNSDRRLSWQVCQEADLGHYTVYGSSVDHRDGTEVPLALTTTTEFDVASVVYPHFLVTASDVNGNEGAAALLDAMSAVGASSVAWLRLLPCQPNPFNPSTTIRYELPGSGPVRIAVFDVAGRRLRTLCDGEVLPAGNRSIAWDGRDDGGRAMSAGAYVARLEFGGEIRTIRMSLVK